MPSFSAKDIPATAERGTLNPELAAWLPSDPRLGTHEPIHEQRVSHDRLDAKTLPPVGRVDHLGLAGPQGTIPVRVDHPSEPASEPTGALIYLLHGGGWMLGTLDQFEFPMRLFAEEAGIQVYTVDYKLAPEHQFPAQAEENEFVVRWLHAHAIERGVDPNRIALGGDSAGGNMTCVIAQKLRDDAGPRLALQVPLYPKTALPFNTKAGVENLTGLYLETAGALLFA